MANTVRTSFLSVILALLSVPAVGANAPQAAKANYWGSLGAGEARMRTGPGRSYPASWLYERRDLPVRVIDTYPGWRKIRDPDGTEGWMIEGLISTRRTGMIVGGPAALRDSPNEGARILWQAAPGVIGTLSHCGNGWCRLDVKGRGGFVEESHLWGLDPDESFD